MAMNSISTDRMLDRNSDASLGRVVWKPTKSLWTLGLLAAAIIGGPLTFTWDAFALFLVTTAITICAGHSVGMHRLLIHKSFSTPKWVEHLLVYLGTLVGMVGPFGMIAAHDIRDWAQRQAKCHDLFAHRKGFFRDAWWQMHCAVALEHPPELKIEDRVKHDRFYRFVDGTWMLQQLPWAVLFYALGGLPWVIWGIAVRITLSLHGHWLVGHFAHRSGQQNWVVDGVAVQ
jgi:sn-1 stearoyl-lipid 9-desaturase